MEPTDSILVFLDANMLFSAALGGESFQLLWAIAATGKARLCTSRWCKAEAEANIVAKKPSCVAALQTALQTVALVRDPPNCDDPLCALLPAKDAPVLAAALAAHAHVLLTGDVKHFGVLMPRRDLPLLVGTLRQFLLGELGR